MLNKSFILKTLGRALLHFIFWCSVLLFYIYFFGAENDDKRYVLTFSLFLMPITIATTYVSIYKLIPDYLLKKRFGLFALYSFYTVVIATYLIMWSVFYGLVFVSTNQDNNIAPISRNLLFVTIAVFLIVILVSAFKLLKLNLKHAENTKALETKILETQLKLKEQELNYLKMQIHPHFLFNTLNTMYGFALKKADETPDMILKLSNLLDYLLYQVDKPFVLLNDEVAHIKDYIELEKMRFNDTLNIQFSSDSIPAETHIAPMLLIPFIENSFKHGTIKHGSLNINIDLRCMQNRLYFTIENTSSEIESISDGIGLTNIKKRLHLLYPKNHELNIAKTNHTFKVDLILNTI